MQTQWYQEILNLINKYLNTNLPFQLIHFPSTGVSSALNRYSEILRENKNENKLFIIDFKAANFIKDSESNKNEFYRVVSEHIEQYLPYSLDLESSKNFYRKLQEVFESYISQERKVFINLQNLSSCDVSEIFQFKDFLIFLDRLRDNSGGKINFFLTASYPLEFKNSNLPVPIITKYFDFYKPLWLEDSIENTILKHSTFNNYTHQDVEYLIDLSGGLVVLVKALVRDLSLQEKDLETLDTVKFDSKFFDEYINVKYSIERIFQSLKTETINCLIKLVNDKKIEETDVDFDYLKKVGLIDEKNKIRGQLISEYLKLFYPSEVKANHSLIEEKESDVTDSNETQLQAKSMNYFLEINPDVKMHKISGEIYLQNKSNGKYLSEKELEIFLYLYNRKNNFVSRDEIAKILWVEESNEKYSDWAIDKTISRIREKFDDDKPYHMIKTIRGKGFMLAV